MKNSTNQRSITEITLFRNLYKKDAKLDEKTLETLKKRWNCTKSIEIFYDDQAVFESKFGFVDMGWCVQQALILLENFERKNIPFIHTKQTTQTISIGVNGRLYDALMLKADEYECSFESFILSLVHAYACHVGGVVTV